MPMNIDEARQFALVLSKSSLVPNALRDNPASCLVAFDFAQRFDLLTPRKKVESETK
jgi:hypothetical protein